MGKSLGNMDMLIAAHAIAVRAVLVTTDKAMAQAAPGLKSENWATDLD
jgi:tRNA(fMet)-specific endonuclease VapC